MRHTLPALAIFILLAFAPQLILSQKPAIIDNSVQLGTSRINITPSVPVILSGYDARKTPSTGIHDSLFASALFFSGPQTKALIISVDMIGFPFGLVDALKAMISLKTSLPLNNILIIATHNHGGPAIHTYEEALPAGNEVYIQTLKEKLLTLAVAAAKNPQSCSMGMAKLKCNLNINRRAVFADGGVWLGRNPDGACDHELDVIEFKDRENKLMALLVNWPCHGTVMGQDNYLVTGDWPAAAARYIRKQLGSDIVVAVTAGASANINPIYGPGNDFGEAEAVGYHVSNAVIKGLEAVKTSPIPSLHVVQSTLSYPAKKGWASQFPQTSYRSGEGTIRLTGLKLGETVLLGVSGELMTEYGEQIKQASPYPNTVVLTHCNGLSGYICTDKAFIEGGYEPEVSHFMPGIEQPLLHKCLELLGSF